MIAPAYFHFGLDLKLLPLALPDTKCVLLAEFRRSSWVGSAITGIVETIGVGLNILTNYGQAMDYAHRRKGYLELAVHRRLEERRSTRWGGQRMVSHRHARRLGCSGEDRARARACPSIDILKASKFISELL